MTKRDRLARETPPRSMETAEKWLRAATPPYKKKGMID